MDVKQVWHTKESKGTFEMTDLDYDIFIILIDGFRRKKRYVHQRKALLNSLRFETHNGESRKQLYNQIKYLESLEKRLAKAIEKMDSLISD